KPTSQHRKEVVEHVGKASSIGDGVAKSSCEVLRPLLRLVVEFPELVIQLLQALVQRCQNLVQLSATFEQVLEKLRSPRPAFLKEADHCRPHAIGNDLNSGFEIAAGLLNLPGNSLDPCLTDLGIVNVRQLALRRRRLANQVVSNRPGDLICSSL